MTAFKELDVVRLKSAIPGGGGWTDDPEVPAGAVGTIVHVHKPRYEVEFTDADGKTLRVASVLEHDLSPQQSAPVRINASERIRNSRPLGNVLRAAEAVANEWWLGTIPTDETLERLHKAISDNNELYNAMTRCDRCGQVICECDPTVKP